MPGLKERVVSLLQDPRATRLLRNPKVQELVLKAFRIRGRAQGAFEQRMQQIAGMLSLATQRDLRALQRRLRHLERELREADERFTESEDDREARARN